MGMKHGWLTTTVSGRKIEHIPCPNPGGHVVESAPPTGVVHTVEGSLESGLGVFRRRYAPHFVLDGEQIIQLVPLGTMAAALENRPGGVETNSITRAQIEVAGHSSEKPWCCDKATGEALAELLATLAEAAGIPLSRPFEDKMPAKPWATTSFARRSAGKWGHVAGWYGHVEVPENEHWDPGAFEWTKTIERAKALAGPERAILDAIPAPESPPTPIPDWYWPWLNWILGEGDFKSVGARSRDDRPADAPTKIPHWAWVKAGQFTAARKKPH
jgi:hypothetical protein